MNTPIHHSQFDVTETLLQELRRAGPETVKTIEDLSQRVAHLAQENDRLTQHCADVMAEGADISLQADRDSNELQDLMHTNARLELELSQARRDKESSTAEIKKLVNELDDTKSDRDEVRAALRKLEEHSMTCINNLSAERDEALEELDDAGRALELMVEMAEQRGAKIPRAQYEAIQHVKGTGPLRVVRSDPLTLDMFLEVARASYVNTLQNHGLEGAQPLWCVVREDVPSSIVAWSGVSPNSELNALLMATHWNNVHAAATYIMGEDNA